MSDFTVRGAVAGDAFASDDGGDSARRQAAPAPNRSRSRTGHVWKNGGLDAAEVERGIDQGPRRLILPRLSLTRLKRLDQLTTLDHPLNQRGEFTSGRILSIQRLSHHGTHRDQLLKPTFSLRNSRDLLAPLPCIVHRAQTFSVYGLLTTVNSTDFIHYWIPLGHEKEAYPDTEQTSKCYA